MKDIDVPEIVWTSIGSLEVVAILDGKVANAPEEAAPGVDVAEVRRDYPELFDEEGVWRGPVTCYLVRTEIGWVLLDSGIGPRRWSGWPRGSLDTGLAAVGIAPSEIVAVVMSHLHDDHVGWNTVPGPDGSPVLYFENAAFYTTPDEWAYWTSPELLAREDHAYLHDCVEPLRSADLRLVAPDHQIAPGVRLYPLPGHTPGHSGVRLESDGVVATLLGDSTHYLAQIDHPEWSPTWDVEPELAAQTRRRVFEDAAADPSQLLIGGHWAFPGIGRLRRTEEGIVYEPVV